MAESLSFNSESVIDEKYAMIIDGCETIQQLAPKATMQLHPKEADNNAAAVSHCMVSVTMT
jgi:hypothetical protein